MFNLSSLNLFLLRSIVTLSEVTLYDELQLDSTCERHHHRSTAELEVILQQMKMERQLKEERKREQQATDVPQFTGKFRYFTNPDDAEENMEEQPSSWHRVISAAAAKLENIDSSEASANAMSTCNFNDLVLESDLRQIEQLLKSAQSEVPLSVPSVYNQRLQQKLKQEKVTHERLQLLQLEQNTALKEHCDEVEGQLAEAVRHQVNCSICLDPAEEILQSERSLLSTWCGHIFCDHCLHRAILNAKTANKRRPFSCPRCRTPKPSAAERAKFAHPLFF